MQEFKMCSDGEFMPTKLPCPPPYSGPYYYYPYENIPFPPPAAGSYINSDNNGGAGGGGAAPISAGAVAGIIILVGLIIFMMCFFAIKFRTSLLRGSIVSLGNTRNMDIEAAGDLASAHSGDVLLNVVGGGLEEKLVNLLPVFEYVRFQDDGKELFNVQQKLEEGSSCTECAVCLSVFEEKDIVRILPKCKHVFHLLCIDKWFESHANCPLCRERITLQTIQYFLENSDDRTLDVVDGHQQQLGELDACQHGANHLHNHGVVNASTENRSHPVPNHCPNCPISQQETEASPACAPHNHPFNDLLPSGAGNEDGPHSGHHTKRQYQSARLAGDQKHATLNSNGLTSCWHSHHHDQSSSILPMTHHAVESDKEFPCAMNHAECGAARSATPMSTESCHPGGIVTYQEMRSSSQNQTEGNENAGMDQSE